MFITHIHNHVVYEVIQRFADEMVKFVQDHVVNIVDVVFPGLAHRICSEQFSVFLQREPHSWLPFHGFTCSLFNQLTC